MNVSTIILVALIALIAGSVAYVLKTGNRLTLRRTRRALAVNLVCFGLIVVSALALPAAGMAFAEDATAPEASQTETQEDDGMTDPDSLAAGLGYLAAALATGASALGAGIAVSAGSSAAIGATSEEPKMLAKALIFVAMGEGVALYGLILGFIILGKIG